MRAAGGVGVGAASREAAASRAVAGFLAEGAASKDVEAAGAGR